jgi:large subunit ribosomal protein L21
MLGKCKLTKDLQVLEVAICAKAVLWITFPESGTTASFRNDKFWDGGMAMYAVIRAGGKQYRVAPGDVIEIEKLPQAGGEKVQFDEVLAVSGNDGELVPQGGTSKAFVTGEVVEQGRGDKVLVFHYKRKKQYKKLNGHRQPYTAVKITGISMDGKDLTA